jgi:hypothetical protein
VQKLRAHHGDRGRAAHVSALVRALGTLLLVVFGWSVSLAFVSPCSAHAPLLGDDAEGEASSSASSSGERGDGCCPKKSADAADPGDDDRDDDAPCSCPVDCGDCCDGAGVVALPPEVPVPPTVFAELIEVPAAHLATHRAEREPRGIFHVPRAA